MIFSNIKIVFSYWYSYIIMILFSGLVGYLFYIFSDFEYLYNSISPFYAYFNLILQILISILFGINLSILFYKLKFSISVSNKGLSSFGFGTFFSLLVSGCSACSISLASYIGLGSLVSLLPFYGIELKIFGFLLLLFSTYYLLKNLMICKRSI